MESGAAEIVTEDEAHEPGHFVAMAEKGQKQVEKHTGTRYLLSRKVPSVEHREAPQWLSELKVGSGDSLENGQPLFAGWVVGLAVVPRKIF